MKTGLYAPLLLVLLFGSIAKADQAVDLQDFNQFKQMMLPVLTKSIEPLKQTRKCVVQSANSDQLNTCVRIMAEFQRSHSSGSAAGSYASPQMPRMKWSRALAEQIRSDLDRSLHETSASIKCMQSSDNHQAMSECMQKAGVRRE